MRLIWKFNLVLLGLFLQLQTLEKRPGIMAQVQGSGWPVPGEHDFFAVCFVHSSTHCVLRPCSVPRLCSVW